VSLERSFPPAEAEHLLDDTNFVKGIDIKSGRKQRLVTDGTGVNGLS